MNRIWFVLAACVAVVALASCGDNVRHGGGGGDGGTDAPDADTAVCGDGMITGAEQCETGACCDNCMFTAFGSDCRAAAGACDAVEQCDGQSATCPADGDVPDGTACGVAGFCTGGTCEDCDPDIDADFDGSNQCDDCNDNNGIVYPGRAEACNGLDDDCDGLIDEPFDLDNDGYSTCSTDPLVRDCNDNQATTYPGAPELCGTAGTGNGRDDNCNGYIDETCMPCTMTDVDGDGVTECEGDCDDNNPNATPGSPEACDGFDTDCNKFTIQNCDVSDECNFPANDVCKDDLQCGCVVDANDVCTGNYRCASFCQGSFTGPIGAGCTATQSCAYRWTNSDNQHACSETTATLGTKLGGATCATDTECRSGQCADYREFTNDPVDLRCVDFCDHHAAVGGPGSCATGTTCEIVSATVLGETYMYATCGLDNNGTRTTGQSCSAANPCKWGSSSCVNGTCAQPCGVEGHCPAGTHCSLRGNRITSGTWGAGTPAGINGLLANETVPVCLADTGVGLHDRPGGAACSQNGDCSSQFCEATLNVCIDVCVTDASCAVGLTCEPVYLKPTLTSGVTWGRACVNGSMGEYLRSL